VLAGHQIDYRTTCLLLSLLLLLIVDDLMK
jgi:hypothetical protein